MPVLSERAKTKLRSRRGASITFALLLFLICAVVGSVVLTAATAASGRMSAGDVSGTSLKIGNLYDYDQRYYAVTSAVGLFRDALNGQSYTIKRTESVVQTRTTVTTVDAEGVESAPTVGTWTSGTPTYSYEYLYGASTIEESELKASLLGSAAFGYLFGSGAAGWNNAPGSWSASGEPMALQGGTLTVTGIQNVRVSAQLCSDGSVQLTFVNDDGGDPFRLTLTMEAVAQDDSNAPKSKIGPIRTETATEAPTDENGNVTTIATTETRTVSRTKTMTITWSAGDVRKAAAA